MFAAILLMAGSGLRMGGVPKQYRLLRGKKVYRHTLDTFLTIESFSQIILVVDKGSQREVEEEVSDLPNVSVTTGGGTRRESSYCGLLACDRTIEYVVIHDAVRPFVSEDIIHANMEAVQKYLAVDTCIPTADTIVESHGSHISSIPNRNFLLRGQTPQSFSFPLIKRAHEEVELNSDPVCDCYLTLQMGVKPYVVLGEEKNMKITTETDWMLAEVYCEASHCHL